MAKSKSKSKMEKDLKNLQEELRDSAHKVWLAGLGALSTVEEEGSKMFQQLVDKGRSFEAEGKKQVKKARTRLEAEMDKAKDRVGSTVDDVGGGIEDKLTEVLHRFGVPTREEIHDLTRRVEELTAKIDHLKGGGAVTAKKKAPARKVYHVAPDGDGWKVEAEGAAKAASLHPTKDEAMSAGRDLAKSQLPSQVIVHRKDGTFQTEYSYDVEPVTH